ncbi:hypothetical protein OAX78_04265, partial [Planctomycetota bacterium]|nr:hypothetical protein [Planctomycetota bacterium]
MDVDSIRLGLEAYRNAVELDTYELARGLRKESQSRAIRARYPELFTGEARHVLDLAVPQAKERGLKDDAHSLRILREGLLALHVQRELAPIDAAISRHGRVVFVKLPDGTRRPLRDMKLLLAETPNPEHRGEIEDARVAAARELVPLLSE